METQGRFTPALLRRWHYMLRGAGTFDPYTAWHQITCGDVFTRRTRLGLSQAAVSCAAKVASGYFAEIENGRRLAPPHATAMRIAGELQLRAEQAQQLVALAEAVRAALTHDAHLAPGVLQLLTEIRSAAPQLPREAVEHLRARLREVSM